MKAKDIRELNLDELKTKLTSLREELFKLKGEARTGRAKNPKRMREIRKDVARFLTAAREKKYDLK